MSTVVRGLVYSLFFSMMGIGYGQPSANLYPDSYQTIESWGNLPNGRVWGATSAVYPASDGSGNIWVAERCGQNDCAGSEDVAPILLFSASGEVIRSFGEGLFAWPHGIFVDGDNNVWVTDARVSGGKGAQVHKFSENGELLMSLGTTGYAGHGQHEFRGPSDVLVAPNGDIFVADGHGRGQFANSGDRIMKFNANGEFLMAWGSTGTAPGEFQDPHALALDSQGRLYVGDRENRRVQIFDQNGNYINHYNQFGRPSGLFIDKQDNIYVADSESRTISNPGYRRGIWIADPHGWITGFIPDPEPNPEEIGTSLAEGVAVDSDGNIYAALVGPRGMNKYVKR